MIYILKENDYIQVFCLLLNLMKLWIYAVGKNQVDYAWEHGKQIIKDDNKCYVKCNYILWAPG